MKSLKKYLVYPCILLMASACTDLEENLKGDITTDISIPGLPGGGGGTALLLFTNADSGIHSDVLSRKNKSHPLFPKNGSSMRFKGGVDQ